MSKVFWIAGLVSLFSLGALAQEIKSSNVAFGNETNIQECIQPMETLDRQLRASKLATESLRLFTDRDRVQGTVGKIQEALQSKGVNLNFGTVWQTILEQARSVLDSDSEKARDLTLESYKSILNVAYNEIARNDQWVAEHGEDDWHRYVGWMKLTKIRIKQREFVKAEKALWTAASVIKDGASEDEINEFSSLAIQISQGLIEQEEAEIAKAHLRKMNAIEVLAAATVPFQPKLIALENKKEVQAILSSGSTSDLLKAVETKRAATPDDEGLLSAGVVELMARKDTASLVDWATKSTDCGIRVFVVESFQKTPNEPFLDLAEAAVERCPENPAAQNAWTEANYRKAEEELAKIAAAHPKDNATAMAMAKKNVEPYLAKATHSSVPPSATLTKKIDSLKSRFDTYMTALGKSVKTTPAKSDNQDECTDVYNIAKWASDNIGSAIDLPTILNVVTGIKTKKSKCADDQRKQLDQWFPEICAGAAHNLGYGVISMDNDKKEPLLKQLQVFVDCCRASIKPVDIDRLDGVLPARTGG